MSDVVTEHPKRKRIRIGESSGYADRNASSAFGNSGGESPKPFDARKYETLKNMEEFLDQYHKDIAHNPVATRHIFHELRRTL